MLFLRDISRSQTHLSWKQRRKEKRSAETTKDRHQAMEFNCFAKRDMFYSICFIYLLLLNVVFGFGHCNHWNLTFWAKRSFVYVWFGIDWGEIVSIIKAWQFLFFYSYWFVATFSWTFNNLLIEKNVDNLHWLSLILPWIFNKLAARINYLEFSVTFSWIFNNLLGEINTKNFSFIL